MAEKGRSWLRCGCLGCLAVVVTVVFAGVAIVGIAWFRANNAKVEEQTVVADLGPAHSPKPDLLTEVVPVEEPVRGAPRQVVLDLGGAFFRIRPGEPGTPLTVDAKFDANSYELTREEKSGDDGAIVHEVRFRAKHRSWITSIQEAFSGNKPEVDIALPPDVPFSLRLTLHESGAEADLGGLWLEDVEVDIDRGGVELTFSEPLREPARSVVLRTSMVGLAVAKLGNASPRKLDVTAGMSGFELDLGGAWTTDCEIDLRTRMGGLMVRVPTDVHTVGLDASMTPPPPTEAGRPTLRFTTSSQMGEVEFDFR